MIPVLQTGDERLKEVPWIDHTSVQLRIILDFAASALCLSTALVRAFHWGSIRVWSKAAGVPPPSLPVPKRKEEFLFLRPHLPGFLLFCLAWLCTHSELPRATAQFGQTSCWSQDACYTASCLQALDPCVTLGCWQFPVARAFQCLLCFFKIKCTRTSLAVQWLESLPSNVRSVVWFLVGELRSHIPLSQKKTKHKTEAIL